MKASFFEPNVVFGVYNESHEEFFHLLIDKITTFGGEDVQNPDPEWFRWDDNPHADEYPLKVVMKKGWVNEYGQSEFTALLGAFEGLTRFYCTSEDLNWKYVYAPAYQGGLITRTGLLEKRYDNDTSLSVQPLDEFVEEVNKVIYDIDHDQCSRFSLGLIRI
jgi:hypothetical protein